jgi:hypothetical protein
MDSKIFNELKNKGYITSPFVKAEDFKTFEELVNSGYGSGIGIKTAYDEIIKSNNIIEKPIEEVVEPVTIVEEVVEPKAVIETSTESFLLEEDLKEEIEEPVEKIQDIIVDEKEELTEKTNTKPASKKS